MGANVTALKALYVALGGDADDVANVNLIADMINAIATLIGTTGGQLPAVSGSDNGKVLKAVVNGSSKSVAWGEDQTGPTYTAGDGISISNGEISAQVDGTTIQVNSDGELEAIGGGGSSYTAGSGVKIANDVISLNIGAGLKFDGAGGPVYVQYPLPMPKTLSAQGKYLQVTDSESGTMAWTAINGVPDYTISDAGKVLTVNSGAIGVEWATPSGGGGYTPVDLDPITEGPYTIPVGNREDVYVEVSGYTASTTLTLQLANDCTDAIVTVYATGETELSGLQVSRGNTNLQIYGGFAIAGISTQSYVNNNRVLLATVDGGSAYEPPTDFSEIAVEEDYDIVGDVSTTTAYDSLRGRFLIEIKGRSAILHKP